MTLSMIEVTTHLFGLATRSATTQRYAFRSWRSYATAAHKYAVICC